MRVRTFLTTLLACAAAGACSGPQAYGSGQAWQQGQCNKIIDMQDRERCMAQARGSYDHYQKQVDELKKPGGAE